MGWCPGTDGDPAPRFDLLPLLLITARFIVGLDTTVLLFADKLELWDRSPRRFDFLRLIGIGLFFVRSHLVGLALRGLVVVGVKGVGVVDTGELEEGEVRSGLGEERCLLLFCLALVTRFHQGAVVVVVPLVEVVLPPPPLEVVEVEEEREVEVLFVVVVVVVLGVFVVSGLDLLLRDDLGLGVDSLTVGTMLYPEVVVLISLSSFRFFFFFFVVGFGVDVLLCFSLRLCHHFLRIGQREEVG